MTEAPKKKLIEVALPLEEINAACKADKDRKTGTIRNLHKWFAPAPLAAWRALLFAALVDDPGDDSERAALLDLIKRLVVSGADPPAQATLDEAMRIIAGQFPRGVPTVMDPFCGGGSTLVEAQRLGLPTFGSDLNPVPVLITRTLTELLPKVHGLQPLHPGSDQAPGQISMAAGRPMSAGYQGLIQDVTHYAEQIRIEAAKQLQHHYPTHQDEKPISWFWARTAICPNPACGIETVLTTTWWLSKRQGDSAWIEPRAEGRTVRLNVVTGQQSGSAPAAPKVDRGAFACVACGGNVTGADLRSQGAAGGLGIVMTAVLVEVGGKKKFRNPDASDLAAARGARTDATFAEVSLGEANQYMAPPRFGLKTQADLYTPRQLLTLATFADLVAQVPRQVIADGGNEEWADAVTTLLGLTLGKMAQYCSSQARIEHGHGGSNRTHPAFGRNDLPMTWDFVEVFPLGETSANWTQFAKTMAKATVHAPHGTGTVLRVPAQEAQLPTPGLVATDPPYFDAIAYADLSDYFYIWHRRALKALYPDLYSTLAAPKSGELTAFSWHHGGTKEGARTAFIEGFTQTFKSLQNSMAPTLPMLVVYASKEQKSGAGEETRWESILTAMIDAQLEVTATWPIYMAGSTRMRSIGSNAVAAYIVMACRPRQTDASTTSLSDFSRALRRELPAAIRDLQAGSILPVDLYQAALGPGMQIYSRYRRVEDSYGERVPVGRALELITSAVGEVLDEQEGELDVASRFAVTWWEENGWNPGSFGDADKVARGYGTHVDDVVRAEVVTAVPGKGVKLLGTGELDRSWIPAADAKPTAWEAVHHLADRLINGGGEVEAAQLLANLGGLQDSTRTLAYRLHDIAAKKSWAKDQERYNALIGQWTSMLALAATHDPEGLF